MPPYYPFRWVYAGLTVSLLCVIGFYYDLSPRYHRIFLANTMAGQLQSMVGRLQKENQHSIDYGSAHFHQATPQSISQSISKENGENANRNGSRTKQLIKLVQLHWLHFVSLEVLSTDSAGNTQIQLIVKGNFAQWLSFLIDLQHAAAPILIENFFITTGRDGLIIEMAIRLLKVRNIFQKENHILYPGHQAVLYSSYGPLCPAHDFFAAPSQVSVHNVPLSELKMVGFMQRGAKKQAILASPAQSMWTVEWGSTIGKEQAKVIGLTAQQVEVQLSDGTRRTYGFNAR
jgi:hypothetical protein